jgi:AhpD family alkylhydroperoxidase
MARVPYVDAKPDESPQELVDLYAEIGGLRGAVLNLYRALGNQPPALRAFMAMSRYVRDDAELPANLRELAVLATAYALDAPYEIFHHVPAARRAGVTEEQLAALPDWQGSGAFDATERAVLAYAVQVARMRDVDDATFEELRAHLPLPQVVDLTLTCGWYHLCAAVLGPLRIETEDAGGGR